jgi:hypothetical protein
LRRKSANPAERRAIKQQFIPYKTRALKPVQPRPIKLRKNFDWKKLKTLENWLNLFDSQQNLHSKTSNQMRADTKASPGGVSGKNFLNHLYSWIKQNYRHLAEQEQIKQKFIVRLPNRQNWSRYLLSTDWKTHLWQRPELYFKSTERLPKKFMNALYKWVHQIAKKNKEQAAIFVHEIIYHWTTTQNDKIINEQVNKWRAPYCLRFLCKWPHAGRTHNTNLSLEELFNNFWETEKTQRHY